jgi:hypothetical protein
MRLLSILFSVALAYYINQDRIPPYEASRQWTVDGRGMNTDKSFETKHFQGKRTDGQRINTVIHKDQAVDFSVVKGSEREQNGQKLRTIQANKKVKSQTHNLAEDGSYVGGKSKNKQLKLGQKFINGAWVTDHYGGYYEETDSEEMNYKEPESSYYDTATSFDDNFDEDYEDFE